MDTSNTGEPSGKGYIETIGEIDKVEGVVADLPQPSPPTPVVLNPAKPEIPKFMKPTSKAATTTKTNVSETTAEASKESKTSRETSSSSTTTTKMTTQVKQVPKRPETKVKIEPKRETTPEPSASSGMGIANTYAGDVADSTNVDPNNSSANPVDNLWVNYKGTGQDVRDEPAGEHQTVEISGHQVRFPPPPAKNTSKLPSGKRATSQNVKVLKKRGRANGSPSSEPKTFLINMHKTIVMRMTDSHVLTPLHMEAKGKRKASPRKENPKILANQKDRENQRIQEKERIMAKVQDPKRKGNATMAQM